MVAIANPVVTVTVFSTLRHRRPLLRHLRGVQPTMELHMLPEGAPDRATITLSVVYRWRWRPFTAPRVTIG